MQDHERQAIADELAVAHEERSVIPLLTTRHPDMTVEDSYAVQALWAERRIAAGRRVVGHKIGLTSKAMQQATGITEPDYGVILDDQVFDSGATLDFDAYSNVRVEVELAFVLGRPLQGPHCTIFEVLDATDHIVPALEVLNSHIELDGRTIVDTIADNAAAAAMVTGGRVVRPMDIDLRWVAATLSKNGVIEESGVSAAIMGHPAMGIVWLANKLALHGITMQPGHILLAGSFTRPTAIAAGDTIHADFGPLGAIGVSFS